MTQFLSKLKIPHFHNILGPGASSEVHLTKCTPPRNSFYHVEALLQKLREKVKQFQRYLLLKNPAIRLAESISGHNWRNDFFQDMRSAPDTVGPLFLPFESDLSQN